MGQAKQRKAEITALKAQPKLVGFGAYYKDDADDGVSIMWNGLAQPEVKELLKTLYPAAEQCFQAELAEFNTGNFAYFNDAINRETAINDIFNSLRRHIKEYNRVNFGTEVRPLRSTHQVKVNSDMIMLSIGIMTNIWLLQELGEIQNDNFNGMNFVYAQ